MIRDGVKQDILDNLNYDIFRLDDFIIQGELTDTRYNISISKEGFYFKVLFNASNDKIATIMYSPGEVFLETVEKIEIDNFIALREIMKRNMRNWLNRVKGEMLNPIQVRYFDNAIESFLEEMNVKLDGVEDTYFTKEEGNELARRLEQLEELMTSKADDAKENKKLLNEMSKMKKEIDFLKQTINKMPRKRWLKNTLLKIRAWGKDPENQELLKMGVETVKAISQIDMPNFKG